MTDEIENRKGRKPGSSDGTHQAIFWLKSDHVACPTVQPRPVYGMGPSLARPSPATWSSEPPKTDKTS